MMKTKIGKLGKLGEISKGREYWWIIDELNSIIEKQNEIIDILNELSSPEKKEEDNDLVKATVEYFKKEANAKELAIKFHETYERLAPNFGYETREETKRFNETTPNGKLMIAVCGELLGEVEKEEPTQEFTKEELEDIQDIYTLEVERFGREFGTKSNKYLFVKNLLSKIEGLLK